MKRIMLVILVILFLGFLFFFLRKDERDLGEGYYYLPKYEAVDVGYPEGAAIYKSHKKLVFSNVKIHGNIICVKKNREFILAILDIDSTDTKRGCIKNLNSTSFRFFIINKKADYVYGPFNKTEYLRKREELKVNKSLSF
jgi:hypothetical protein